MKIGIVSAAGKSLLKLGTFVDVKAATGALDPPRRRRGPAHVTDFAFHLPGDLSLTGGDITVSVNTSTAAVKEVVTVGSTPIVLDLPAGPTVTVRCSAPS